MLEKLARDLARDLNDSYLDAYRSKTMKPKVVGTQQKSQATGLTGSPGMQLRDSKELPFKKYVSEK